DLTVAENLLVGARPDSGWTVDRVFGLFPKLAELARQRGGSLSGGEQQMLTIARTLMTGPRLLLLDEPSEGLAPVVVAALAENVVVDITAVAERKRLAMQAFPSQQTEFDYPRAMDGLNTCRSLHRGRARGLAEAFHVAELDVYRRLFDLIAIGLRRAATA